MVVVSRSCPVDVEFPKHKQAQKEAEVKKAEMELKGCTFTPEVLPSSQAMIDDMTIPLDRKGSFGFYLQPSLPEFVSGYSLTDRLK